MTDITAMIDSHLAAYGEPDQARRAEAVQRIWSAQGQLVDPPLAAQGHGQIVAQADALLAQFPGHRFERSSGIDSHHGCMRYAWKLVDPSGSEVLQGIDFAQLDAAGRLAQVTGFFGPLPVHEAAAEPARPVA